MTGGELILYQTEDGRTRIQLRAVDGTLWLTQLEMASLFDTTKQNVSLHVSNIFKEDELPSESVVKDSLTTAADGKAYRTKLYNLDMILAVGYRVRSPRGSQFRRWATTTLREYLVKGFVMNDERLKDPGGSSCDGCGIRLPARCVRQGESGTIAPASRAPHPDPQSGLDSADDRGLYQNVSAPWEYARSLIPSVCRNPGAFFFPEPPP